MHQLRFVAPQTDRWPAHWQRPTEADLNLMHDRYRGRFLPPHHQLLNQSTARVVPGSPACLLVAQRLHQAAQTDKQSPHGRLAGLAAPQLGIRLRMVLFDTRERGQGPPELSELACVANPTLQPVEGPSVRLPEGCISTGRITGWVTRPTRVLLEGYHPDGTRLRREYTGRAATVLQHEVDHLDGIRFPDRTDGAEPLLWVPVEQDTDFAAHVQAVLRGDPDVPTWPHHTPRDQWEAIKTGTPIFGDLAESPQSERTAATPPVSTSGAGQS